MSEQNLAQEKESGTIKKRPRGRSLFWPIALIAAGTFFLLANLNLIAQPDWRYALGFWPLLLIFIGLDILVTQASAPLGTFLSLVVSLAAVGIFAFLLFGQSDNVALRALVPSAPVATQEEIPFTVPVGTTETADIELELGNDTTTVTDLTDSDALLAGSIWTSGELMLDVANNRGRTTVKLGETSDLSSAFNPALWFSADGRDLVWRVGINARVPTDLQLNGGNGSISADLGSLTLTSLRINASNGRLTGTLPAGTYDGQIDGGNGSLELRLPSSGRQALEIDGGNGGIRLLLPAGVPARVEFDEGNGSVNVDARFDLVAGDGDEGVYETPDYSGSGNGVLIDASTGNGSLSISQP